MLLVFGLAHGEGGWTQSRLLLTGVIVAAGCGAVVTLMLAVAPEERLRGMLFWLMGDLSQTGDPRLVLILLVVVLLIALPFARELNLLARGADLAQALGVAVRPLRRGVYLVASLATAGAVTHAGAIGFIGLIVPHLVRLATGNDQRLAAAGLGARRRQPAGRRRHPGAQHACAAATPGGCPHGADRRAGFSVPALPRRTGP
jgi:iron complex transport system permease protein